MKKALLIIMMLFLASVFFIGCFENNNDDDNDGDVDSIVSIQKSSLGDKLIVLDVESDDLDWSDIKQIGSGTCSIPNGKISVGDEIINCDGDIVLKWDPTNVLLGSWDFTDNNYTPSITFEKDNVNGILRITGVDPDNLNWSDVDIVGSGSATKPTGTIYVGDEITGCSGTINLRYNPTNTLLGTWEFT